MAFASKSFGMLSLASCAAFAASVAASGCIATTPVEFTEEENYPPSAISQPGAQYPLREIGQLDLDVPVEQRELPLEVIIRDPNIDQTLEYRVFVDSPTPPGNDSPIDQDFIDPSGEVERPWTFNIPYDVLTPAGECHKIELLLSGGFASPIEPRRPLEEGDVDDRTWWIEVTDSDNPVIIVEFE
jgi:hypothetical protein